MGCGVLAGRRAGCCTSRCRHKERGSSPRRWAEAGGTTGALPMTMHAVPSRTAGGECVESDCQVAPWQFSFSSPEMMDWGLHRGLGVTHGASEAAVGFGKLLCLLPCRLPLVSPRSALWLLSFHSRGGFEFSYRDARNQHEILHFLMFFYCSDTFFLPNPGSCKGPCVVLVVSMAVHGLLSPHACLFYS